MTLTDTGRMEVDRIQTVKGDVNPSRRAMAKRVTVKAPTVEQCYAHMKEFALVKP